MRAVFGLLRGVGGALLVAACLGGAKGDPGPALVLGAMLSIPILVVSFIGVGASAALAGKGCVWLIGLGIIVATAAVGLAGGCIFFAAARNSDEGRDALIPCILAGAGLAAAAARPPHRKGGDEGGG